MQALVTPPTPLRLAGHTLVWGERTFVMGVINLTSDSFSGDGLDDNVGAAVAQAERMLADGADLLDVGAESTRPGFQPVSAEREITRLLPVVERLRSEIDIPISVDTTKGPVARAALATGASLINDTCGFRGDPDVATAVAEAGAAAIVMHNQRGRPFQDVIGDVHHGLMESFAIAHRAGISPQQLIVDPGFGFGWTAAQSAEIIRRLEELRDLHRPILIGVSRKSAIGAVLDLPVDDRLEGTAAALALAIANGADIVRVHDVRAMVRVARMADAIARDGDGLDTATEGSTDG